MKFNLAEFKQIKKNLKPNHEISIVTGSMSPWIKPGETVFVSPSKIEELKPFDIIVYWQEENEIFVCHIFVEIRDNKLITKPLARNIEDNPVPTALLLGKVTNPKFKWYHKLLLKFNY